MHLWPQTPMGRRMTLQCPTPEDIDPHTDRDRQLFALLGRVGRTITQLRPAGITDFDGRRVDTMAEGRMVEPNTLVRVIEVRGQRVLVREIQEDKIPNELGDHP